MECSGAGNLKVPKFWGVCINGPQDSGVLANAGSEGLGRAVACSCLFGCAKCQLIISLMLSSKFNFLPVYKTTAELIKSH